jgi:Cyclic nucleotide-binding domain/HEAT repeats
MTLVARAFRVRSGEGRLSALLLGLMFVSSASAAIGESGIDAVFFDHLGTRSLPLMYLLQAGTTFAVMLALAGVFAKLGRRRTYLAAPVALSAAIVIERLILATGAGWIYPVLWTTVPLGLLVQGIYVWGVAGAVTETRQAKRLFPLFAAGGILGSVAGGLLTRAIAQALGAPSLSLVWAGGLLIASALVRVALGPAPRARARRRVARRGPSALREVRNGLAYVRRSRLLVWMTVAAVLFSVLYYSLYLPYARAATDRFPDAEALAGFFGLFWAGVTAGAFLLSILVTNRLFARFGVAAIVVVLPALYVGAFAIVLAVSGFVAIVAVRFVSVLWLQGVASPGWETLINVVPESRRDQTRAFINGGPTQAGTAIAGLVALAGRDVLTPRQFAAIGLFASLVTVGVALAIRRSYSGALLDALRAGRPQLFGGARDAGSEAIERDASVVRVLSAALGDPDVHVRRLAVERLAAADPSVRPPELRRSLEDSDGEVRAAAVLALDPADVADREALLAMTNDEDARVAAVASVRSLGVGEGTGGFARLRELLEHPADLAWARLDDLAPAVRAAALGVLARLAPERARPAAVAALRDGDPGVRVAAGRALGAGGIAALDDVLEALSDPASAVAATEAVRLISGAEAPERVRTFATTATADAARYREAALGVAPDGPVSVLLADALLDRARRIGRSALWALSMTASDREAIETAIENLDGDAAQLSAALETIESAADRRLVAPLLVLWEPSPASRAGGGDSLRIAMEDDDPLIRASAALVLERRRGGTMSGSSTAALTLVERVLHLRAIPLLEDLTPTDLERVAAFAEERTYTDGETIAAEGELGDELHIVVDGEVRVVRDTVNGEVELMLRTRGDVIGELSIITREPRVASLVAAGDVRTIRIGRRDFESLLRERPEVALAVMRVLAARVAEHARGDDVRPTA